MDGDGRAEPDPLGPGGGRGEEHLGGGHGEVAAVVLPHSERMESDFVRELGLVE